MQNNPLPPLPLVDGELHIDNSFLESLQTCTRALEYRQLWKKSLATSRPALSFGTAIHQCLDLRYSSYGSDLHIADLGECTAAQGKLLAEHFTANPSPEGEFRTLNWAMEILRRYNEKYSYEPFNLLQDDTGATIVERGFKIPFLHYNPDSHDLYAGPAAEEHHIPVCYTGKIDLPTSWDGHLMIMDHKTTSIIGDSFWDDLRVSPQQTGYSWAWWKLTGQRPIGFVVNAIRTRPQPDRPKGGLAAWWEENFQRQKEYLQPYHFDEWESNTAALIEEFFWHYNKGYFPLKRKWCVAKYGRCQFYDVCYSPAHQREMLLQSETYEDYTWSPLD